MYNTSIGRHHGEKKIVGSTPFKMHAESFIISPLSDDATLYINSINSDVKNPIAQDTISAGDYTTVSGVVPFTEFYVDTTETFYIKW